MRCVEAHQAGIMHRDLKPDNLEHAKEAKGEVKMKSEIDTGCPVCGACANEDCVSLRCGYVHRDRLVGIDEQAERERKRAARQATEAINATA